MKRQILLAFFISGIILAVGAFLKIMGVGVIANVLLWTGLAGNVVFIYLLVMFLIKAKDIRKV